MPDNRILLEPITLNELPASVAQFVTASAGANPGTMLKFHDVVLAREEVNANNDEFTGTFLADIAAGMKKMPLPIDFEHVPDKIVGAYSDANHLDKALPTAGFIYSSRFPDVATGLLNNSYGFSIEASSTESKCSKCGGVFGEHDDYCIHIRDVSAKKMHNARRILVHGRAVGGAVTRKPAGSGTRVDPDKVDVLASLVIVDSVQGSATPVVRSYLSETEYMLSRDPKFAEVMAKVLTTEERNKMKDSEFALIQDGERRFPIGDCNHARNALARLPNAKNLSDEERASIKRKAEAKLNSDECKPKGESETKASIASAMNYLMAGTGDADWDYANTPVNPEDPNLLTYRPVLSPFMARGPEEPFINEVLAWMRDKVAKPAVQAANPTEPAKPETTITASAKPEHQSVIGMSFSWLPDPNAKPKENVKYVWVKPKD